MYQQINLFQPIFRKERKLFSFDVAVQIVAIFLIGLVAVYTTGVYGRGQLSDQLSATKKQNSVRLAKLADFTKEVQAMRGSGTVDDQIARLKAELEAERHLLKVLGEVYNQHRVGFSSYLEGFARRSLKGMWIGSFDMKNGGKSVKITGGTLDPALIPKFIQGLSDEPALVGTKFERLSIQRKTPNRSWVEFSLSSGDFEENSGEVDE